MPSNDQMSTEPIKECAAPSARVNFDDYSEEYDEILNKGLGFFNKNIDYFAEYKVRLAAERMKDKPRRILEFGCGTGRNMRFLPKYFPGSEIFGCDISAKSLSVARRNNPEAKFILLPDGPGESDNSWDAALAPFLPFDLVLMTVVFHHIPVNLRAGLLNKLHGCISEQGQLLIFENNPYNPITRYLVSTFPFDADAVLITAPDLSRLMKKSGYRVERPRYVLFFPEVLKIFRPSEKYLEGVPLGGQYFVQGFKR